MRGNPEEGTFQDSAEKDTHAVIGYRSVFNHCDIMGQQSYRIRWRMQNKGYPPTS